MDPLAHCAWCSDLPFPESLITEKTDAPMRDRLADIEGILDPAQLTFCNAACQERFHANLRRLHWNEHEPTCACVVCLG